LRVPKDTNISDPWIKKDLSLAKLLRKSKDRVSFIEILNEREAGLGATVLRFGFLADHFRKSYL